jgi:hypothetical protein
MKHGLVKYTTRIINPQATPRKDQLMIVELNASKSSWGSRGCLCFRSHDLAIWQMNEIATACPGSRDRVTLRHHEPLQSNVRAYSASTDAIRNFPTPPSVKTISKSLNKAGAKPIIFFISFQRGMCGRYSLALVIKPITPLPPHQMLDKSLKLTCAHAFSFLFIISDLHRFAAC